ncbi:MAG: ATP12 family protein [Roseiarcus sp.]|jgi:chaperone required for assembly of F1-ATPase
MSEDYSPGDPMRSARNNMRPSVLDRFFREASVAPAGAGFEVRLDGRGARTPARNPFVVPTRALAQLLAAEWAGQGATMDPAAMPATRIANSAIDGVAAAMLETRAELAAYAETDLLFYRAGAPEKLVAAQAAAFDPTLDWAHGAFGVRFILAQGIIHVRQPERSLAAIRAALDAFEDPFSLAALHVMTTLTGSILLALAVARGAIAAPDAWGAAHVDEDFQIRQWGEDDEATARRAARWREMAAADGMLKALG